MNELKPQLAEQVTCSAKAELAESDVMRALECCTINQSCDGCPMFGEKPEADCNYYVMSCALALLREKDALLAEWDAKCNDYETELLGKDAEIGRLTTLAELGKMRANDYRAMRDKAKNARAEAITEFCKKKGIDYVEDDLR